ncbi:MAG: DUF1043 family protein [Pseudomonadota bacterium]
MFSLTTLIIAAVIGFVIGCITGAIALRYTSPKELQKRSLATKLQDTEEQLKVYQQEVTDHFAQTAKLVNHLTQSYRDVHEHLASDALKLANVDISRQLLSNAENNDGLLDEASVHDENFQPPKDWAPKSPGTEGTLSEGYGLKDEHYDNASMGPKRSH